MSAVEEMLSEVGADGNVTDRCESASAAPGGARAP